MVSLYMTTYSPFKDPDFFIMARRTPEITQRMSLEFLLDPPPPPNQPHALVNGHVVAPQPAAATNGHAVAPQPAALPNGPAVAPQPATLPNGPTVAPQLPAPPVGPIVGPIAAHQPPPLAILGNATQINHLLTGYRGILKIELRSGGFQFRPTPPAATHATPPNPLTFNIIFCPRVRAARLRWRDRSNLVIPFNNVLARYPQTLLNRSATRPHLKIRPTSLSVKEITCTTGAMPRARWVEIVAGLKAVLPEGWEMIITAQW